jgi:hypothetical protein
VVGEFLYATGTGGGTGTSTEGVGEVRETACDGSGEREPDHQVTHAVTGRDRCPPSTVLHVRLGGELPVGCARER